MWDWERYHQLYPKRLPIMFISSVTSQVNVRRGIIVRDQISGFEWLPATIIFPLDASDVMEKLRCFIYKRSLALKQLFLDILAINSIPKQVTTIPLRPACYSLKQRNTNTLVKLYNVIFSPAAVKVCCYQTHPRRTGGTFLALKWKVLCRNEDVTIPAPDAGKTYMQGSRSI